MPWHRDQHAGRRQAGGVERRHQRRPLGLEVGVERRQLADDRVVDRDRDAHRRGDAQRGAVHRARAEAAGDGQDRRAGHARDNDAGAVALPPVVAG
jgi:hypothetical protein